MTDSYRVDKSKHPPPKEDYVGAGTEDRLGIGKMGGKRRAPQGLPHLPGGAFGRPMWDDYWKCAVVGQHKARMESGEQLVRATRGWQRRTAAVNPSLNPGTVVLAVPQTDYTYSFGEHATGRGESKPMQVPPDSPNKYGWYHQARRNAVGRGRPNRETQLWAQTIKKSKDHIGYGNGMIGYGDVQSTSLAGDSPSWMFGMRMIPGVVGSGFPRWPYSMVEATDKSKGELVCKNRYFQRGPNLSTIEQIGGKPPHRCDRQVLDFRQKLYKSISARDQINRVDDKAASSLKHAGSVCKTPRFPISEYKSTDPDFNKFGLETNRSCMRLKRF